MGSLQPLHLQQHASSEYLNTTVGAQGNTGPPLPPSADTRHTHLAAVGATGMPNTMRPFPDEDDEPPRVDNRQGKERVQRPCTHCGHKNHIRKNLCDNCEMPKQPAKKRPKRPRRKKRYSVVPGHAYNPAGSLAYAQHHQPHAVAAAAAAQTPLLHAGSPHAAAAHLQQHQHPHPQGGQAPHGQYIPGVNTGATGAQAPLHDVMAQASQPMHAAAVATGQHGILPEPSPTDMGRRHAPGEYPAPVFDTASAFPMMASAHTTHSFNTGGGSGSGGVTTVDDQAAVALVGLPQGGGSGDVQAQAPPQTHAQAGQTHTGQQAQQAAQQQQQHHHQQAHATHHATHVGQGVSVGQDRTSLRLAGEQSQRQVAGGGGESGATGSHMGYGSHGQTHGGHAHAASKGGEQVGHNEAQHDQQVVQQQAQQSDRERQTQQAAGHHATQGQAQVGLPTAAAAGPTSGSAVAAAAGVVATSMGDSVGNAIGTGGDGNNGMDRGGQERHRGLPGRP